VTDEWEKEPEEEEYRWKARNFFEVVVRPMRAELIPHKVSVSELNICRTVIRLYRRRRGGNLPEFAEECSELERLVNACMVAARADEVREEVERRRLWEARMAALRGFVRSVGEWVGVWEQESPASEDRQHAKID
jgi:Cytochrome c oxidase biogenesis protein Cmc1 like